MRRHTIQILTDKAPSEHNSSSGCTYLYARTTKKWLPILEHMRTDWAQEIIELGREIKLTGFVVPVQMVELYHARP